LLQHGSILLQDEQALVAQLSIDADANLLPQQPADFPALLDREASIAELIEAIGRRVRARWPGTWRPMRQAPEVLGAASELYPTFRSPAWTWKR
jgi:hypothetical protein